jgi:sugar phosphate isomerase/epimerase
MDRLLLSSAVGWGFPTWAEPDVIALLRDLGISHAQIFRNRDKHLAAETIRGPLNDAGLTITSLHAFFAEDYDPSLTDESARAVSVANLSREADFVRGLGGRLVVVHPGSEKTGGTSQDADRVDALRRSAEELTRVAESLDVVYALENLPPGHVGDDMAVLRSIVDQIDSPHLGLNYDSGHANLTGDPISALDAGGSRIVGTHIHDNDGSGDEHLPPGSGDISMDDVCRGLARHRYSGEFTLELMDTVDSLRGQLTDGWLAKLDHWLDLASGTTS